MLMRVNRAGDKVVIAVKGNYLPENTENYLSGKFTSVKYIYIYIYIYIYGVSIKLYYIRSECEFAIWRMI